MKPMSAINRLIVCVCVMYGSLCALTANPLLSSGKMVYSSSGDVSYLTDGQFGSRFMQVTDDSWIAVELGEGPQRIFLTYNDPAYAWASAPLAPNSCPNEGLRHLIDYDILISSNSSNGSDGSWQEVASVENNLVTARGHAVDFTGAQWVKIQINEGGGNLDEIEIFDITDGARDIWFFAGTSISANTYKADPPDTTFADRIHLAHPSHYPSMIRGGIGRQNSTVFAQNISTYLEMAGSAHFWAIEHGTNDAWGGGNSGVETFRSNLQLVIDSCKAHGIEPVLARVIATNEDIVGWQVHQDYLTCIDELTEQNDLIPGLDLFRWFDQHPEGLTSDGVHPNAQGNKMIQRLWAEKMDSLYSMPTPVAHDFAAMSNSRHDIVVTCSRNVLSIHNEATRNYTVNFYDLGGRLKSQTHTSQKTIKKDMSEMGQGMYVVTVMRGETVLFQTKLHHTSF